MPGCSLEWARVERRTEGRMELDFIVSNTLTPEAGHAKPLHDQYLHTSVNLQLPDIAAQSRLKLAV